MTEKIDRPLVKMTRTTNDGSYDFYWYETMMGKQNQINEQLLEQITILKNTITVLENTVEVIDEHKDILQKELNRLDDKILIFQPWNFKKKKRI